MVCFFVFRCLIWSLFVVYLSSCLLFVCFCLLGGAGVSVGSWFYRGWGLLFCWRVPVSWRGTAVCWFLFSNQKTSIQTNVKQQRRNHNESTKISALHFFVLACFVLNLCQMPCTRLFSIHIIYFPLRAFVCWFWWF